MALKKQIHWGLKVGLAYLGLVVFLNAQTDEVPDRVVSQDVNVCDSAEGCVPRLSPQIAQFINQPDFENAYWGICACDLTTGEIVNDYNSEKFFVPSSSIKLITAGAAIHELGADSTIKTTLYSSHHPTLKGELPDLFFYGRGDPMLLSAKQEGYGSIEALVDQLVQSGVTTIQGDIIIDDTYLNTYSRGKGWEWNDAPYYFATAYSALFVDDNVLIAKITSGEKPGDLASVQFDNALGFIDVDSKIVTRTPSEASKIEWDYAPVTLQLSLFGSIQQGSAPQLQRVSKPGVLKLGNDYPTELATYHLLRFLEQKGIVINGSVRMASQDGMKVDYSQCSVVAEVQSPTVCLMAAELMRNSTKNANMELLGMQVGAKYQDLQAMPREKTHMLASRAGIEFMKSLDINPSELMLVDGSGLSRLNRVTPRAFAQYLQVITQQPWYPSFLKSIPSEGFPVKDLPLNTAQKKGVHLKSGTMAGMYSLAGYLQTDTGRSLAVAVLLNHYDAAQKTIAPREAIGQVIRMLVQDKERQEETL